MAERRGSKVFLWIMLALLAVGLVGWGSGGLTGRTTSLGSVGDQSLDPQAYANALRARLAAVEEQIGQPLPFDQARAMGLDRQVLASLVTQATLDAETARIGLSVGDTRVRDAVVAAPSFQGIDGTFDRELYRDQLARNGLDEESFEASLRNETSRTMLQAAILGGVPEPAAYADAMVAYIGERRTITWAPLPFAAVEADLAEPTDADLRGFYDANPETFTAPETRAISYAWITPEMIQGETDVDDEAVRALYDERIDEFVQAERRLVERLVFPDEAAAEAARARIDAGEGDFEAEVAARGLALADVDLGDVALGDLGANGEAVFAADVGAVIGPLPTDLGPALLRVNAVLAADEIPYEEAEPDLRVELANQRARRVIADLVPGIEDLIAGGATIEDLAEQTDLEPGSIVWSEGVTEGIAAYETFREAAAALTEDEVPQVVEMTDGSIAVLRLDSVSPPALRPYDEVAAEVAAGWRDEALRDAVLAEATARSEAIAGGASFEDQGLTPTTEPPLTRRDVVPGGPPDLVPQAFTLAAGEAGALASEEGAVVLRVDAIEPPSDDDPAVVAERAAIATEVSQTIAQDVFAAYAAALQRRTEVRIDEAAVTAVTAQFP